MATLKKPIDIALDEIVNLKKVILMLRKDIEFLKLSVSLVVELDLFSLNQINFHLCLYRVSTFFSESILDCSHCGI